MLLVRSSSEDVEDLLVEGRDRISAFGIGSDLVERMRSPRQVQRCRVIGMERDGPVRRLLQEDGCAIRQASNSGAKRRLV